MQSIITKDVKAKKEHKCICCAGEIKKDEVYVHQQTIIIPAYTDIKIYGKPLRMHKGCYVKQPF